MNQGICHNQVPMISMVDVIDKIAAFREEALRVAKDLDVLNNSEAFYSVLQKYGYSHGKHEKNSAIFLDLILLLEERLNKILNSVSINTSFYTFWFNYNPRFFSDEKLGRIINDKELAYRLCRENYDISFDIIDSQNKDDYNVYYFRRVIGRGSVTESVSKDIISIQQLLSCHKEIEIIKVYRFHDELKWEIKKYGGDHLFDDVDKVHLFDSPEQKYYYTIFLKQTFGININESELPLYLKDKEFADDFEKGNAKYTPNALYMCNLSAPYSTNYSGSIMFASDQQFDTILITREIDRIKSIVNLITDVEAQYLHTRNKQLIIKEANKSAKSAIMSRNMSHNIGSHVMSYLKQHLGSVKDIVADGILSDLINGESELAKKLEYTTENTTLPFLMGLGHFISYLQERQDFIATIATDYIPYFGNVNFKDAIYDELNPDKRAERHSERKNGKTDNILLGNIARSEGLGRKTTTTSDNQSKDSSLRDIILRFRDVFDGNRVVELDESGNIKEETKNQEAFDKLEEMREYDFSLPGGIVGRQAFFSIMENIIRNAAKHGNWREQTNLEFNFDIYSCKEKDLIRLPSNDNVNEQCLTLKEVIEKYYIKALDAKDLYIVTVTDNCNFATVSKTGEVLLTSLGKLRNALSSNYINDSGEMDNENKGLKEMRISAAWMRAIKDESICFSPYAHVDKSMDTRVLELDKYGKNTNIWKTENVGQRAPLLYARISAKKKKKGDKEIVISRNLQYIFCVQIPKKVAVILNNNEDEIRNINNNLERINWRAYTAEEFLKERNRSYEFILIDDECADIEQTFFDIRSGSTSRTFLFSQINDLNRDVFLKHLKKEDYDGKEDLQLLYKSLSDYQGSDLIVIDDKTAANRNKNNKNIHIKIVDGISDSSVIYIYRRHHEAEREFTAFMRSKMKDSVAFVEGISGNNSTDRLVRNEELDDSWFYRHLRAMKQQIAIFDERLFSKITGLEETNFVGSNITICKDNTALSFIQKGIYPFTFIADKTNNSLSLIGILYKEKPLYEEQIVVDDPQAPIHTYKCKCGCIATITFKNKELVIECNEYGEYVNKKFHSMTIHQGLLDKIYELFGIKGNDSEKKEKEIITGGIFNKFSNNNPLVLNDKITLDCADKKEFLPGIIIHSGRSKPNESDMPQKLPFIQYASLEHAVLDCKYSLVELLDFARYES